MTLFRNYSFIEGQVEAKLTGKAFYSEPVVMMRREWLYVNDAERPSDLIATASWAEVRWGVGWGVGVAKDTVDLHSEHLWGNAPEEGPLCFSGRLSRQYLVIVTARLTTWVTLLAEAVFLWGNRPLSTDSATETRWDMLWI